MSSELNLYQRVRISPGREGFVLGITWPGAKPGQARPQPIVQVLTDDYCEVTCCPWQCRQVRRDGAKTVPFKDALEKGRYYQVEVDNEEKRRMAIWHDHWKRFGGPGFAEGGASSHQRFWREYKAGRIALLPVRHDVRQDRPTEPQKPSQLRLLP